jgi:trehalose utilization protein
MSGMYVFKYEGETSFNLPSPYCVVVEWLYGNRGVALAIEWRIGAGKIVWVNNLHDTWESNWRQI